MFESIFYEKDPVRVDQVFKNLTAQSAVDLANLISKDRKPLKLKVYYILINYVDNVYHSVPPKFWENAFATESNELLHYISSIRTPKQTELDCIVNPITRQNLISNCKPSIANLPVKRDEKQVRERVEFLINKHLHNEGWVYKPIKRKRCLGCCKYSKKEICITTAFAIKAEAKDLDDTILHEIAHALAGYDAKHGLLWKAIASKIGATPKACSEIIFEKAPYNKTCENRCFMIPVFRRTNVNNRICNSCKGKILFVNS